MNDNRACSPLPRYLEFNTKNDHCPVCADKIDKSRNICELNCTHLICELCLDKYIDYCVNNGSNDGCPSCRAIIIVIRKYINGISK